MKLPNGYGSVVKLSGNRRNPYLIRKTNGWHFDKEKNKQIQEFIIIGYAPTRAEGLQMLADYNKSPFDTRAAKMTFQEVYEEWSMHKYPMVSQSNVKGYTAAYKTCSRLHQKVFRELKLTDLQRVVDTCGKNYPTLKKVKVLFHQLYDFAIKNDICSKNYSVFVDVLQYKERNPNRFDRNKFSREEVERVWKQKDNKYYQIVLMLLYNGVRISEFLDLKKENVHLEEQYFDVVSSKTENGIRKVPIADKVLPFYREWFESDGSCEYLIYSEGGKHFRYRNYYEGYFKPLMEQLEISHTPHCCRHTCISMLAEAGVDQTMIKKIVGHSGAMTLTEKVYTHFDVRELVEAINRI